MQPVAPNFRLELHAVLSSGYEKEKEHVEKQKPVQLWLPLQMPFPFMVDLTSKRPLLDSVST